MRSSFTSILVLSCLGMGGIRPPASEPGPSPAPVEARFRELGKTYGAVFVASTVSLSFRYFFGTAIGLCRFTGGPRNQVELSTSAWTSGSDTFREMLLFHELGHCLLGRDHKNSKLSNGQPESVMNSYIFDTRIYTANRDGYLKELFTAEGSSLGLQRTSAKEKTFGECGFGRAPAH